ncbi:hypothetical protein DFI02_1011300 [Rhizobium sp. PP-F2F-G20b]|nr:hypothetical protein DFI02_1011300 [Rhizobium sp. PP-F2F-G20b]
MRKVKDGRITTDLYAFLTCPPNGLVGPIHPKAMPVILPTETEVEAWLTLSRDEARALQQPLLNDQLVRANSA